MENQLDIGIGDKKLAVGHLRNTGYNPPGKRTPMGG
jgi:hypothetical protein